MKLDARLTGLLLLACLTAAPAAEDRLETIVRTIDQLYRSDSSYSEVEMSIVTPHWQRTLDMKVWTAGMEKTFVRILSPKKESGMGTLRLGSQMWNYLPRTNKIIKIPPSMMMSSWMGSDFTNDDLVKEFTFVDDYTFRMTTPADAAEGLLHLECRPKPGRAIVWNKVAITVREQDYLPVRLDYYDEKERLMRTLTYSDVAVLGGRTLPTLLEMTPRNKTGQATRIRYKKVEFDAAVDEQTFSLRHLRSRSIH